MIARLGKSILLNLFLFPVFLCIGLTAAQIQGMISYRIYGEAFGFAEEKQEAEEINTIVDDKVRMDD